jgi:hypothetical protein
MPNHRAVRRGLQWTALTAIALMWSLRPSGTPAAFAASVAPSARAADAPEGVDDVITIDWRLLRGLDFRRGTRSDTLRWLEGRRVRLPGFIVPLEDFQERAKEFLLVPYFGACVHLPPPPPNQMVYATLRSELPMATFYPVWIEGTLRITNFKSPYGVAGFRMQVSRVTPYEDKQP